MGRGVLVKRGVELGVIVKGGRAVAVGGEEPSEAEARAAMAGGSPNRGKLTRQPTVKATKSKNPSAGRPPMARFVPRR